MFKCFCLFNFIRGGFEKGFLKEVLSRVFRIEFGKFCFVIVIGFVIELKFDGFFFRSKLVL